VGVAGVAERGLGERADAATLRTHHPPVVPANAGTHNHRSALSSESRRPPCQDNIRRGVWVPDRASAFALRATADKSLVRDDEKYFPIRLSKSRHTPAFPRRVSPEFCNILSPQKVRGRRECRVLAAPAVSCAMCTRKCAHEHTGTDGAFRHSLRSGFTAYAVLSPETNSSCLRRRRIEDSRRPGWAP
jgi:hypothetical protein